MERPLKIIIFDGSFKTTPFINRLTKGLARRHEVYILGFNMELAQKLDRVNYVPLGSNQNKFRFVATCLRYAISSASLPTFIDTLRKLLRGERNELQEQNLRFLLHEINPDIIHLQWPSVISWFEEVLQQQNIPIILSQRGAQNNVRPFVEADNFEYLQQWYPKIAGFHSVAKSLTINSNLIWNAPKKIDRVIYTGLYLNEFLFHENYRRLDTIKLLSVGRTHWIKGYDYAIQSCKILKERGVAFQYTIIGGAGDEELQFLIEDLGLQEFIHLTGRMPQADVFNEMKQACLLLMPSVEEGIPNVVVEAMALGVPVLSTDCGGILELIDDGVEGWLVPIRNPEAMAEKVIDFSNLPLERINEVRRAARKKVELQHSEEEMVLGMEELYYEVLLTTKNTEGAQSTPRI